MKCNRDVIINTFEFKVVSLPIKIGFTIFILTLIAVGSFGAYQFLSSTINADNYLSKGDDYFKNGQYSNALAEYQKGINGKNDPQLYLKIANIYEVKKRFTDAVDILKKGIEKNSNSEDLNYQLGEDASQLTSRDSQNIDIAVSAYDKAKSSDKYKNLAIYKEAKLTASKADKTSLDKAKELFISIDFLPAKYELVLYDIEDPDKALNKLNDLSKLQSNEDEDKLITEFTNWQGFGKTFKEQLNELKTDITNNKSKATVLNSKGYVAYKMNRCEFGIDNLKNAITESEKEVFYPQARIILSECLKRINNYVDAKTYVQPVYDQQKDSLDARLVLRQIYKGLNDKENMKKIYDELITLDGQNLPVRLDYSMDSEYFSDWSSAATQYEWLGLHLTDTSIINNQKNTDFSLNQKYLIKAYDLYTYKLNDYKHAEDLIDNAIKINDKFINSNLADDLTTWSKYIQKSSDVKLDDIYDKSKNLTNANGLYHAAFVLKDRKEKTTAKEKAFQAYDKDENGYVAEKAAELVDQLEK